MQKLESLGLSRRLESPHECPTGPAMIIAFAHKSTLDPRGGGLLDPCLGIRVPLRVSNPDSV